MKRGHGARALLKPEIENALQNTKSVKGAARYLGCSYPTFRKYAKMYGLFDQYVNHTGAGIPKFHKNTPAAMANILVKSDKPYPISKLQRRLIREGYLKEQCSMCTFQERRLTDLTMPLRLEFIDRDRLNRELSNLRLLCFNCYYLYVGNFDLDIQMRNRAKDATVRIATGDELSLEVENETDNIWSELDNEST